MEDGGGWWISGERVIGRAHTHAKKSERARGRESEAHTRAHKLSLTRARSHTLGRYLTSAGQVYQGRKERERAARRRGRPPPPPPPPPLHRTLDKTQEKNLVFFLREGGKRGREEGRRGGWVDDASRDTSRDTFERKGGSVDEADAKSFVDLLTDSKSHVDFARSASSSNPARVRRLDKAQEKSLVSFLTKKR